MIGARTPQEHAPMLRSVTNPMSRRATGCDLVVQTGA